MKFTRRTIIAAAAAGTFAMMAPGMSTAFAAEKLTSPLLLEEKASTTTCL